MNLDFTNEKDRKKFIKDNIDNLVTEIALLERELENQSKSRDKYQKSHTTLENEIEDLQGNIEKLKKNEADLK